MDRAEAITYYNQRAEEFRRKAAAQPAHRDHYLACAAAEQEAANALMRGEVQYAQWLCTK